MAEKIKTMQADQHPIGSIYLSIDATNPAVWFGGTWERLKDRFLLAAGDKYAAGSTGGEAEHVLTVKEMPNHTHSLLKETGSLTDYGGMIKAQSNKYNAWANPKTDDLYYWWSETIGTGGSQPHNNLPPYLAVYTWVRIA